MLIEKLQQDTVAARRGDDPVAKSLMVTLYSEASMVGKNRRNGASTDDEVIAMVKKFVSNAEQTMALLTERHQDTATQRRELEILNGYLPQQMTHQELSEAVRAIVTELGVTSPKGMGQVMATLKTRHGATYDAKLASELVKSQLT